MMRSTASRKLSRFIFFRRAMTSLVYPERLYTKQSLPFSIGELAPPLGALPGGGVRPLFKPGGALVRLGTERTSPTDSRLLQVEVALYTAHDLRGKLALVAHRDDGFTFCGEQFALPVSPGGGTLRVLLGGFARLQGSLVAPDKLLVVLAHGLLSI